MNQDRDETDRDAVSRVSATDTSFLQDVIFEGPLEMPGGRDPRPGQIEEWYEKNPNGRLRKLWDADPNNKQGSVEGKSLAEILDWFQNIKLPDKNSPEEQLKKVANKIAEDIEKNIKTKQKFVEDTCKSKSYDSVLGGIISVLQAEVTSGEFLVSGTAVGMGGGGGGGETGAFQECLNRLSGEVLRDAPMLGRPVFLRQSAVAMDANRPAGPVKALACETIFVLASWATAMEDDLPPPPRSQDYDEVSSFYGGYEPEPAAPVHTWGDGDGRKGVEQRDRATYGSLVV